MRSHTAVLAVTTAFAIGSFSAHCATPARAPMATAATATAAEPCATACAPAPRSPALSASASARIAAAKKLRPLVYARFQSGGATLPEYLATSELEFRATRDSGIVGPELVAAASEYIASMRKALELVKLRYPRVASDEDLARAEYAVAEGEYWLEDAKSRR